MRRTISTLTLLILVVLGHSQDQMTMYNMRHLPQVIYANPATLPISRFNIGIVANHSYAGVTRNEFDLSNAVDQNNNFDAEGLLNGLLDQNQIGVNAGVGVFHLGFTVGRNYFTLDVSDRTSLDMVFPKEMAYLINDVYNNIYTGQNINIDNVRLNGQYIRQQSFGWTRVINEKLSIGARFNLYNGMACFQTDQSALILDSSFDPTLGDVSIGGYASYSVQTAGLSKIESLTADPLGDLEKLAIGDKNFGFGADFGFRYVKSRKFEISASVLDAGASINWKNDVKNYNQDGIGYEIDLLKAQEVAEQGLGEYVYYIIDLIDSLQTNFIGNPNTEAFTTSIPMRTYVYGGLHLTNRTQLGALYRGRFSPGLADHTIRLTLQTRVKNFLNLSVSYPIAATSPDPNLLGLGATINLGMLQFYAVSDFAIGSVEWQNALNPSYRFGINLTFERTNR